MKLLLNKLTPDNYERLKDQVLAILLEGKDQQAKIINVIFKKACLEEKYCKLYTALCDRTALGFLMTLTQLMSNDMVSRDRPQPTSE